MSNAFIENLERMLQSGQDSTQLRFGLGSAYLKAGDAATAARHLRAAVEKDPAYSAAWKLLGRSLAEAGRQPEAVEAFREGIRVATERGDVQAAREMGVFLKRLERAGGARG